MYKNILETRSLKSASTVDPVGHAVELHGKVSKSSKELRLTPALTGHNEDVYLDASAWLPLAAEELNISPDLSDYVMVPIPAFVTGMPNTNGDAVTTKQALRWDPQFGMPAFKTWKGKPTFLEHNNKDHTKAKGIILDSVLRPLRGFQGNHAKCLQLLAFDRNVDRSLTQAILRNEINTYSIGMYYNQYRCSVCGHVTDQKTMSVCSHTKIGKKTYRNAEGRLAYRECINIVGFENSAVASPAFIFAQNKSEHIMQVK